MNTFKKIAAVTLAAATLATTMITASAVTKTFATTGDSNYGTHSDNVIDNDSMFGIMGMDVITFSSIDSKRFREGNVVLTVDYSSYDAKTRKMLMPTSLRDYAHKDIDCLELVDAKGNYITNGKYCLTIDEESIPSKKGLIDVVVDTNRVFYDNFEIIGAKAYRISGDSNIRIEVDYRIRNKYVLPSYDVKLNAQTNSSSSAMEFTDNKFGNFYTTSSYTQKIETTGTLSGKVYAYSGETYNVTINGIKVGTVTVPYNISKNSGLDYKGVALSYKNY